MDLGGGAEAEIQLFSEYGHVAYQIKGNDACSNMEANILPVEPPSLPRGLGSKGQNSTFSENGNVAYQIIGNDECSSMQVHILSLHTPLTHWVGLEVIFF